MFHSEHRIEVNRRVRAAEDRAKTAEDRAQQANNSLMVLFELRRELTQTRAELGAAIGAALAAVDDSEAGIQQLTSLLAQAKKAAVDQGTDMAPHWRLAEALLALKAPNVDRAETAGGFR